MATDAKCSCEKSRWEWRGIGWTEGHWRREWQGTVARWYEVDLPRYCYVCGDKLLPGGGVEKREELEKDAGRYRKLRALRAVALSFPPVGRVLASAALLIVDRAGWLRHRENCGISPGQAHYAEGLDEFADALPEPEEE